MPLTQLAYGVVLTKATSEVAKREEYRPRPPTPHQGCLFPEVRPEARNDRVSSGATLPQPLFEPIHLAATRTQAAIL
jgi:hypothetical protein